MTTLRDRYSELYIEGDDTLLEDIVGELHQLGQICRMSTMPAVDDWRITRALRGRAEEYRRHGTSDRYRWPLHTPRSVWRRLLPAVTLVIGGMLAWTLILTPFFLGGQSASAAVRVLHAAARTAARQPVRPLRAGEYAYTKSDGAYFDETSPPNGKVWGALVRTTREVWIAPDGSGRIRQVSESPVFLVPSDRSRWEAAGAPPLARLSTSETYDRTFAAGAHRPPLDIDGLHQEKLLRLASNPHELAAAIRAIAAKNSNPLGWEMLTIVGDILGESAAPPQLRASLYQVAATIPSIELVGNMRDRAGRPGIGVAASRNDLRLELVFDPNTSDLLASQETLRRSVGDTSAPAGTAIAYTLYLQSGIVSSRSASAASPSPRNG